MRVIYDLEALAESPRTSIVTIGNFDGVHLAHQQLLRRVVETAPPMGALATAVTFEPHPSRVLAPESAPKLLTSLPHKLRLIEREGIAALLVLPFTEALARLAPEEFVRMVLVERLGAAAIHVGPNFRFGYRRAGDIDLLRRLAAGAGFRVEVVPALTARGQPVSSTRIRQLLSEGHVATACRLLGRPYSVAGRIVPGRGVGREQTVPTLNLGPIEEHLPKRGVYVTRVRLGERAYDSVTNVGFRPTFGEDRLTVEAYLLNFSGDVRETEMEIEFLYRLRDEARFASPVHLKAQIQKDVRRSLKFFRLLARLREKLLGGVAPAPARA